jgi:hypothetical protein
VCSLSLLYGQANANKGQITGTITDGNAAVIANAKVVVRNLGTGISRDLTTDTNGLYRAVSVDPGTYEVAVTASGFSENKISGVVVSVGSTVTVDVRMNVQGLATSVDVGETLLQDTVPVASQLVGTTQITDLPINGRRFQDFVLLTPTAVVESSTRNQISFAGQRGINSNIMLDGADYNQPFFGGIRGGERSGSIITVPQTAIAEFQVLATGYSAEYGRSTGGVMNTISKSGTNEVHGEAFYQIRHRSLSGRNPILRIRPSETLQQFGGGVGGPIIANKLFWFAAAESQYAETPRQVFFPSLVGRTATPQTAEGFNYLKSLEGPFLQSNRSSATVGKVDYNFSNGDRVTMRYNFSDSIEKNAVSTGGALSPLTNGAVSNEGNELDTVHNGSLQYTKLFGPSIVNDFRFTGSAEVRPRTANSESPLVNITNVGLFGARNFLPTTQSDKRWQFTDTLSIVRGKHSMKVGFDFNYLPASQSFGFNQFGAFAVIGTNIDTNLAIISGNGTNGRNRFDDLATVNFNRQIGNLLASFSIKQVAAFFQDSYRVNRKLTLDYGLRWEGQVNPTVEANNESVLARVEGVRFPLGNVISPRSINDTMAQFAPRFGFAYSPWEGRYKTVFRGHTGIFYAATPLLTFAGPMNNFRVPPGDVSIGAGGPGTNLSVYQAFRAIGVDLNTFTLDKLPTITVDQVQRAAAAALGGNPRDPFIGAGFITTAPNFRNPRSFQLGFGTETEVARNFTAGMQFNYVNTVGLNRNRDYNLPAPVIRGDDQSQRPDFQLAASGTLPRVLRPVSTVGALTVREPSARSMYRAVSFTAQYRTKKFQLQSFYTIAQSYSDDDSERDAGGFQYQNSFNLRDDYGFSALDIRHNWTSNGVVNLPWGFTFSGIFRVRSGLPLNPRAGSDLNRDGNNNDRPYFSAGQTFPRNYFRNRGFTTTDMRLLKNFNIGGDRVRLQFSVEAFNIFDVDNVAFGGSTSIYGNGFQANGTTAAVANDFMRLRNADGTYFGQNFQQGSPRQLQGGLRLFF